MVSTSSPRLSASSLPTGTSPGTGSIEVHHGAALIRITARGDHADRLVEDDRDGNCASGNAMSVDAHAIDRRVDDRAETAQLAVDGHPTVGDELVGTASRRDSSTSEKPIQPLRRSRRSLEVGEHRALGHRRQVLDPLEADQLQESKRRAEEARMAGGLLARDLGDEAPLGRGVRAPLRSPRRGWTRSPPWSPAGGRRRSRASPSPPGSVATGVRGGVRAAPPRPSPGG